MQELGGLMEGKVDLDGAAEGAAAQAKQEALAKAREAALTAVEEAQRPLDEAKAAFEDAAGKLLAQGEALQAGFRAVAAAISATAEAVSSQAERVVAQLSEKMADPSNLLPSQPCLKFLLDPDQVTTDLKHLCGTARGVADALAEAAATLLASAAALIEVLKGLPAAAAELSSQIVDVNDAFAKLKAGGDVTPKQLSTLLMTKSSALTTPQFTIPQFSSLELVGAVKAFEGFTREAPLTIKRVVTPKLFDVPLSPLIGCFAQPPAALKEMLEGIKAAGAGVDLAPLKAALAKVNSNQLDTSMLSAPVAVMQVKLKDASLKLADLPWPE